MYLVHIDPRPKVYQSEGYAVLNHPKGKKIFYQQIINIREKIKISDRLPKSAKLFIKWMQFND